MSGEQVANSVFGETSLAGTPRVKALIEAIDGLVAEQRSEEREACAKIAESDSDCPAMSVAAAIRRRRNT